MKKNKNPDRLDSRLLEQNNICYYPAVDSTNLTARLLAEKGAPGYCTVIAEEQKQGRGRLGRNWFSPPNEGLWFSIILRPESLTPERAASVTMVTAASLADYLRNKYRLAATVKWPNDLLIAEKKFGGILTELKSNAGHLDYLVVGLGLNVNQQQSSFPVEIRSRATSLAMESGRNFDRTAFFLLLRESLLDAYRHFFLHGFASFRRLWKEYNVTLGRKATINWPGGSITGLALDLTAEGALLIKDNLGQTRIVNYGEIE